MKMMPPDVISHENQLQHLSEPSIFMLDVFRTADHAGQIFIPHRPPVWYKNLSGYLTSLVTRTNHNTIQTIGIYVRVFRTADHPGQIFIPHRLCRSRLASLPLPLQRESVRVSQSGS